MSTSQPVPQSAAARRSVEAEVRALITEYAPTHEALVGALRRALRKRMPAFHEMVYQYRDHLVISYAPDGHGHEGALAVRADADGVRLYFGRGKELPDPAKVLRGSATQVRWVPVEGMSTLAEPAVANLVDAALSRAPASSGTGRGPLVIRPTAASRRRA
jgi:hypothetical protein